MGMHLFNVKQLFLRRRKYDRMRGGGGQLQDEGGLVDGVASPPTSHKHQYVHYKDAQINKITGQHYRLNTQAQEVSSERAKFNGSNFGGSSASAAASSSSSWGFKMRPKLHLRKQKSLKFVSTSSSVLPPSQDAVQNFLQGPSQANGEDEVYQQQCRDLLRKLSARGNRVPGFI